MRHELFVCLLLAGCGQASQDSGSSSSGKASSAPSQTATTSDQSCKAPYLMGAKYSPGGTVLPHPCEAFDPVTNNPYAVRCVDAMPNFKSGWAGDDFCILPPAPDQGVQVGAHPQGDAYWDEMYAGNYSDYANSKVTAPFEVPPASEVVQNFDTAPVTTRPQNFFRIDLRMRPGSHHIATWYNSSAVNAGWEPLTANPPVGFGVSTTFVNAQSTHADRPSVVDVAPEDQGVAVQFPANASVGIQLHHINPGTSPLLREVWINVWWLPPGRSYTRVSENPLNAPVNYPPNQITDNVNTAVAQGDTRILSLFGHRHAWTTRFSAQIVRANGGTEEIYDSFDWREIPTYQLDSITMNQKPDVATHKDGATSGVTWLHQGDKVQFDCHIDTTDAHAAQLGVSTPTSNLHFTNEAFAGEMCILYLETTGAPLRQQ